VESSDTLLLARQYTDIERPQAALDVLDRARSDELEDAEYWAIRAQAHLQLEQPAEAVEAAQHGLEREPEDLELLDLLALGYLGADRSMKAKEVLTKALELAPEQPLLLAHQALTAARLTEFDFARGLIAQAMRLAPDYVPVLRIRAQVAYLAEDSRVSDYVDELLEQEPEDPVGHALRGNLAVRQKHYVSASRAFDEAARLDPADPEFADVASRARVAAHPLLAPVRPMWRFGRWRSYFLYLSLLFLFGALRLGSLRTILVIVWVSIVILSWFGPRLIRWRQKRKYGGF
jgi:tetratricopeptide (TPR) repeat protein